jgi:hypothetical protein
MRKIELVRFGRRLPRFLEHSFCRAVLAVRPGRGKKKCPETWHAPSKYQFRRLFQRLLPHQFRFQLL